MALTVRPREPDEQEQEGTSSKNEIVVAQLEALAAGASHYPDFIGSEADLQARLDVGRTTLRQAVRQLESHGVLRMKPGPNGGLYAIKSAYPPAARMLGDHITLFNLDYHEILELRRACFESFVIAAARRTWIGDTSPLLAACDALLMAEDIDEFALCREQLWVAMSALVAHPILNLVVLAVDWIQEVSILSSLADRNGKQIRLRELKAVSRHVIELVLRGDEPAIHAMLAWTFRLEDNVVHRKRCQGSLPDSMLQRRVFGTPQIVKLPILTARALLNEILQKRHPEGTRLGTVKSLADHFGVSSDVMRQALPLAEKHGLVRIKRGKGGGIMVGTLRAEATIECVVNELRIAGVTTEQIAASTATLTHLKATARSSGLARIHGLLLTMLSHPDLSPERGHRPSKVPEHRARMLG